ncbi:MAG: hypothetical protein AB1505_16225 [Candidatus Latescibacterota bacterium]
MEPRVSIAEGEVVLSNALVRRVLRHEDDVWRTASFARAGGADEVGVRSDEFLILLMDGTGLTAADYRVDGSPAVAERGADAMVRIRYVVRQARPGVPTTVHVEYSLGGGPYLRKALALEMAEGDVVDRLEVERFTTGSVCDLGGIGEPVFVGDAWFAGLEYPGSCADHCGGLVTLAHHPGLARTTRDGGWGIRSKTAVLGTGHPDDPIELAFSDYVSTIRRPSPKHLLVNNYATSVRNPKSADDLLSLFNAYDSHLKPYGVKLDSLQPDLLGWEPGTLSRPRRDILPDGYRPLRDGLQQRGSTLSLWLSLNGTGSLWRDSDGRSGQRLAEQGIKQAQGPFQDFGGYFCMCVPAFQDAMRQTLRQAILDGDISYFKHDFVQLTCTAEGHGHLPTVRHSLEANLDALLGLLEWERQLKPEILAAPTSYVWLSPWWLMHASYVWYAASDSGAVCAWPQRAAAEWEMNYHDGHIYRVYHAWRHQVPVSAFNCQAFLRHIKPDQEALREWTDYAMMVAGRGLRLVDLYLEPDLSAAQWRTLGESLRWWQGNVEVLGTTRMVGGDPHKGEVYGYAHWRGEQGILCVRNPDVREQAIRVPFDRTVHYRGPADQAFRGRVIYPYVEGIPAQFTSGQPLLLSVPGYTVMLIELERGEAPPVIPAAPAGLIEGRAWVTYAARDWTQGPDCYADPSLALTAIVRVRIPDEEMARCDLFLMVRSVGELPGFPAVTAHGRPVAVQVASGSGDAPARVPAARDTEAPRWSLRCIDLLPFRGDWVEVVAESGRNPIPFMVDVWVVADRPVPVPPVPAGPSLPPLQWHDQRRQTVRLLSYRISTTPLHH